MDPTDIPPFDPSDNAAWIDMQRKKQMASMLMSAFQQSANSPSPQSQSVGPYAVASKRGAFQNIAPILTAALAGKAQNDVQQATQNLYNPKQAAQTAPYDATAATQATQAAQAAPGIAADPNAPNGPAPATRGNLARNPMVPANMDPAIARRLYYALQPAEYAKTVLAPQYAPTEAERMGRAMGLTGSRLSEYVEKAGEKANYIPPVEQRANSVERDPLTNAVIGVNPALPAGAMPQYDGQGNFVGAAEIPHAAGIAQNMEQAEATGKTLGGVVQVPQRGGGSLPQLGSTYFNSVTGNRQPTPAPGAVPAPGASPAAAASPAASAPVAPKAGAPAAKPPAPPGGQSDFWKDLPTYKAPSGAGAQSTEDAKTSELMPQLRADLYKKLGGQAMDASEQERNDVMALRSLGNATVGPESDRVNEVKGILNQFGMLSDKQADKLTSSIELGKYLNNNALANARQKFGGGRLTNTDVTLSIDKLNPGTNMTDKAIYNLTVENMLRSAYQKQMAADYTTADRAKGADPQNFEQWYSQNHSLSDFANQHAKEFAQQALQEWKGGTAAAVGGGGSAPAPTNAQGWALHTDSQGRKAYVSPDKKQYQLVQ